MLPIDFFYVIKRWASAWKTNASMQTAQLWFDIKTHLLILELLAGDSAPLRSWRKYCKSTEQTTLTPTVMRDRFESFIFKADVAREKNWPHRCDKTWAWKRSPGGRARARRPRTNTSWSAASPPVGRAPPRLGSQTGYQPLYHTSTQHKREGSEIGCGVLLRISSTMKGSKRILSMLSSKQ